MLLASPVNIVFGLTDVIFPELVLFGKVVPPDVEIVILAGSSNHSPAEPSFANVETSIPSTSNLYPEVSI